MKLPPGWRATRHEVRRNEITVRAPAENKRDGLVPIMHLTASPGDISTDDNEVNGDELLAILRAQEERAKNNLDKFIFAKLAAIDQAMSSSAQQAPISSPQDRISLKLEEAAHRVKLVQSGHELDWVYDTTNKYDPIAAARKLYHADTILLSEVYLRERSVTAKPESKE